MERNKKGDASLYNYREKSQDRSELYSDSDSDCEAFDPNDGYGSDSECETPEPTNNPSNDYESDSDCEAYEPNDGYDSDTPEWVKWQDRNDFEIADPQIDSTCEETRYLQQIIQKAQEDERQEQKRLRHEQEQLRLNQLAIEQEYRAESARRTAQWIAEKKAREEAKELKSLVSVVDDDGIRVPRSKFDAVRFPRTYPKMIHDPFDINRIWTDQEIKSMRENSWYKLCKLLPSGLWYDLDYLMPIVYAFKHETSFNDDQRFWMIRDLYDSGSKQPMGENALTRLQGFIKIKVLSNPELFKEMLTKWPKVKKIIRPLNPTGLADWEKQRARELQRAATLRERALADDTGLLAFVQQTPLGTIPASKLYAQYQITHPPNMLTQRNFGVQLKQRGIIYKSVWINDKSVKCYILNSTCVNAFINTY